MATKQHDKRANVFVTELNEKEYLDDGDMRHYVAALDQAAVRMERDEEGDSLPQTALLRRRAELRRVDDELTRRRAAFEARMQQVARRGELLEVERDKLRRRMIKFEQFVAENNDKRARAVLKCDAERRERHNKERQLVEQHDEMLMRRQQRDHLESKVEAYRKYEKYLLSVLKLLPNDFLDHGAENPIFAMMNRHEGLHSTKLKLEERNSTIQEDLYQKRQALKKTQRDFELESVKCSQKVKMLQEKYEQVQERSRSLEQQQAERSEEHLRAHGVAGAIRMGVDSMMSSCKKEAERGNPILVNQHLTYASKLEAIGNFLNERADIYRKCCDMLAATQIEEAAAASAVTTVPPYQASDTSILRKGNPVLAMAKSNKDLFKQSYPSTMFKLPNIPSQRRVAFDQSSAITSGTSH